MMTGSLVKGRPPACAIAEVDREQTPSIMEKNNFEVRFNKKFPFMRELVVSQSPLESVLQK